MRRTLVLCAVITVVVAVTGIGVAASSPPGPGGHRGDRGDGRFHVLRVERNAGTDVPLDLDHSGSTSALTIGDEIVSTAEFFIGNREVGKDGVVCTKVRAPEWFQCVATNSFDEGDLTVQFLGDFTSPEPGHFAITGGTRAYFGATGEVTFVDNPAPARDGVTFRFITPR
jgi:hypothetical protein